MLPIVIVLLIFTLAHKEQLLEEQMQVDGLELAGIGFQTSTLAGLVLMVYVARYLAKIKINEINFKESLWQLWLPVG